MAASSPAPLTTLETAEDIERVFLRLVSADNDSKLQTITDRHLCDILELAGRKPEHIQLVTELLTHYNRVVKTNLAIRLPFSRLVEFFQGQSTVTSNLSLVYLKFAKDRRSATENLEALPVFLKSLSKKPTDLNYIYDVFALCLPGLFELSNQDKKQWPTFELSSADVEILARCFQTIIVFFARDSQEIRLFIENLPQLRPLPKLPGLSINEYIQIGKKVFPETCNLTQTKVMILKVLGKGLLDDAVAFPILVAASDSRLNEVDDLAESLLKKLPTEKLVDEKYVVAKLMHAYLGSEAETKKPTDPYSIIDHGNQFVKGAVLPFLSKSKIAPTTYMNNVKICKDGCTHRSARVQSSTMNFFALVVEQMPNAALNVFAPLLFKKLCEIVRPETMSTVALCGIYRCMSIVGKRHPVLVVNDLTPVATIFAALQQEPVEDVAGAMVSCLTTWLPLFLESGNSEQRQRLRQIICDHMMSQRPNCRLAALKYTEALIGDDGMDLRWMLIRASGDQRDSIRSEALRQLEKSLLKPSPPTSMIVEFLWNVLQKDYGKRTESASSNWNHFVHQTASRYFYAMLETKVMEQPAHLRIVEGDDHWMRVCPRIVKMLQDVENMEIVEKAAEMTLFAMTESTDVHLVRIASCFLAACLSFPNHGNSGNILDRLQFAIQPCIQKLRDSTRLEFSNAVAYLLSALLHNDNDKRLEIFAVSKRDLTEKEIPGLAFICAAAITTVLRSQGTSSNLASEFVREVLSPLIKNGYHRPTSTLESSLGALCFILQNNVSALELGAHKEIILELIENCEKIAVSRQDSFSQKTRETATRVIGLLSGNFETEGEESSQAITTASLIRYGEGPPQPELQLIVGEALVDSMLGSWATTKRDYFLLDTNEVTLAERMQSDSRLQIVNERIVKFIRETLEDKKKNANQHCRRAELVWLLVVVQHFAQWKAGVLRDAELLAALQQAFADGLTENDEFSQDISSKGMGIVYGLADESLKKSLVDSLMTTLSEGKRSEAKVESDTKLFEKGQLGSTPSGGKLTTYKELLTLASDLNQPDLVYKFMQLARHNATWNSKMGAAHGFGALLENAREEIAPYLGQLVPKLYRFRYDPDAKVQGAMKSIWASLTADRKNVVDEFANEIAKELLPAITDREYRVRESACLALSDLLRGHDTVEMHQLIPQYLEAVLRARDDVKESVREAANRAADSLSKLIVRLGCSSNLTKANEFLSIALPAVIDQGILKSTVKANTLFCLKLVLDLTKNAGKQLKPYIADLIPLLMDSISESETPLLNYLAVRSNQQQMEALDDARANIARDSPMMTAIQDLLPHIDDQILVDMTPKVVDTLKSSVGMSTRSSAAQLVTQLALRAPQLLLDHKTECDKLFGALIPGVRDRNPSIRKQFANTMSYLAKFVSVNQMKKLINVVVSDLLGDNDDLKTSSCSVISNLAGNSSEILAGYASQIVPYVLLEKCREVKKGDEAAREKHEKWCEVWSELVPSTSAAVRLYKEEILNLAIDLVTNNEVWAVRKQAAVMIGVTFDSLKQDCDNATFRKTISSLIPNLNGRIWDGKVEILNALTKTFEAGGERTTACLDYGEVEEIVKVLRRESSKKNADYSSAALSTLAIWSVVTEDKESARWLAEKVEENVSKLTGGEGGDASDDEMEGLSNLEKEIRVSKLVTLNLTALSQSLPTFHTNDDAEKSLSKVIEYVKSNVIAWKSKQFMFVELANSFEKWRPRETVNVTRLVDAILEQADELCALQKRTVAADALQVLLRMQTKSDSFGIDWNTVARRASEGTAGRVTGLSDRFK